MHLHRNNLSIPALVAVAAGLCVGFADAGIVPVTRSSTGYAHSQDGKPPFSSHTQSFESHDLLPFVGDIHAGIAWSKQTSSLTASKIEVVSEAGVGMIGVWSGQSYSNFILTFDLDRPSTLSLAGNIANNPAEHFGSVISLAGPGSPFQFSSADLNGNTSGDFDIDGVLAPGRYTFAVTCDQPFIGGSHSTANLEINEIPSNCAPLLEFTSARMVGDNPTSIASGDFNNDGNLDIAVENNDSGNVSVLLGNGDGTFGTVRTFVTGSSPRSVAVADLNEDGFADLVVANYGGGTVVALFGNGDGTFSLPQTIATCANPHSVAVGDLNGDGHLDIAVACLGNTNIALAMGHGNGTFTPTTSTPAGAKTINISLVDLNSDGFLDVVAASPSPANVLVTLLGNGDGTFQSATHYLLGAEPLYQCTADFNGDGHPDVAVTQANSNRTTVFLGTGNGALVWSADYLTPGFPIKVSSADFNSDGKVDLLVASTNDTIALLLGDGLGTFAPPLVTPGASSGDFTIGDLDADGWPDVILTKAAWKQVSIVMNRGPVSTSISEQPNDASVLPGSSTIFNIDAKGLNLVYLWKKDGLALSDGGSISGSSTPNLHISGVQNGDQGTYVCAVWGSCGDESSEPATLDCRPIVLSQPPSHVPLKRTLQLTISVPSPAPYSYHWKRNGAYLTNTPGTYSGVTTKTLRILSPDFFLGGTYTCELTDVCGITLSAASKVCLADFNADELIDDADFVDFARAYDTLVCDDPAMTTGCPADFNNDTIVDDVDFVSFVVAYTELLCP